MKKIEVQGNLRIQERKAKVFRKFEMTFQKGGHPSRKPESARCTSCRRLPRPHLAHLVLQKIFIALRSANAQPR